MTPNKYLGFSKNKFLKKLLGFPAVGLLVHWALQGLLYMDWIERFFKLCLDAILTLAFAFLFGMLVPCPYNWFMAFLVAHSLNFLFNSHMWTLLKHYGLISTPQERFSQYAERFSQRVASQIYIEYAAVYGSWARGEWASDSDLDVRVVHDGFVTGLKACVFVFLERARALFHHFPLDIYVMDGYNRLAELRSDEEPVVIVDRRIKEK
ncbi:MAG: nucleotidyltransferase domain-containing protein [Anaerolineales bacterium]|nr:nucleotidyltransferase domain-containing protein [Anaerolineales bacterium]